MSGDKKPVYDLGLYLFCKKLTKNKKIGPRCVEELLKLVGVVACRTLTPYLLFCPSTKIHKERMGERIDRGHMNRLVQMFVAVGLESRWVLIPTGESRSLFVWPIQGSV